MISNLKNKIVQGTAASLFTGTGLVVDAGNAGGGGSGGGKGSEGGYRPGLVVVDRNTVPTSLGDVSLSFGASLEVPAQVAYIHPLHNITVVAYDPRHSETRPSRPRAWCAATASLEGKGQRPGNYCSRSCSHAAAAAAAAGGTEGSKAEQEENLSLLGGEQEHGESRVPLEAKWRSLA